MLFEQMLICSFFTTFTAYMLILSSLNHCSQGNEVITTGTSSHLGNGKNLGTLVFPSLSVSDDGDYKCFATEESREVLSTGTATLSVLGMVLCTFIHCTFYCV